MTEERRSDGPNLAEARRGVARIMVEILVGFVGVYAAFALTAYHERQDVVDRRHQIKKALIAEIAPIVSTARSNATGYLASLARFDSSVAAGRPDPEPFTESVGLEDHVWEATKQAGGLTILDVPTFFLLSEFYNQNTQSLAQYGQLRDLSIAEILPHLHQPDAFLEPGSKRLRPEFQIYRTALRRLNGMSTSMAADGDSLLKVLAKDTI